MSLLDICQDAAEEIGFDAPSTIIGNTDPTAIRLLRLAHRTGAILAKKSWELLIKEATFDTTASEPQYNLESDYRSLVPDTIWNQTTDQPVYKISNTQWSYEKSAMTGAYEDRFRLLGDDAGPDIGARITIHPTPTAVETIYYQYYSKNWLTNGGVEYSAFQGDTDEVIFDEDMFTMGVIWRLLKTLGQPYLEEKTEFDRELEICLAQDGATEKLHADGNFPALSNIPETGFG
jgi:hypothetical protein